MWSVKVLGKRNQESTCNKKPYRMAREVTQTSPRNMTIQLESNPEHTVGDGYLPNCVSPNTALDL